METIRVDFKGFIEVDKEDISLMAFDGSPVYRSDKMHLSLKQLVNGLEDGTYVIDFMQTYMNALNGEEAYEFSISTLER